MQNTSLSVSLQRNYRNAKGNTVFVYLVKGTDANKAKFKTVQGDFYREDEDKNPLWFTTRCIGNKGTIIITTKDKVVPDMSAFEQAASLAQQFGGNFGNELAKATVTQLLGSAPSQDGTGDGGDAPF